MHMETGRPDRRRGQLEAFLAGAGWILTRARNIPPCWWTTAKSSPPARWTA